MLLENLLFVVITTVLLLLFGWYWRNAQPFSIPTPLQTWFKVWFVTVQILGILVPLTALLWWGIWLDYTIVLEIFASYFLILGAQIISETVTLRQFQSVVWVMIPYFYVPYRVWQLYQGLNLMEGNSELIGIEVILWTNIAVWIINYGIDLIQLPLLFRWQTQENSSSLG